MEILGLIGLIAIAFGFPCIMIICMMIMDKSDKRMERRERYIDRDYQDELTKVPIKKIQK